MNESSAKATISKYSAEILNGHIILDAIPTPPADTIRIFLSSTATALMADEDFSDERSAIWQNISPRIREWTRAKYGLEFQLIDLHWEERPEVSEDQLTLDFVRQELRYCHQTSLGPCFVGLIGQRYGRPPLPVLIPQDEFDTIRSSLSRHLSRETRDADILDRYFVLDTNGVPPIYRLIPAGDNINSAAPIGGKLRALPEQNRQKLVDELLRVRILLQKGAEFSVADGTMEAHAAEKYIRSLLDQELRMGIGESALVDKRCLVFIRTIIDLAEQAERGGPMVIPTLRRYAELLEAGTNRLPNGVVAELSPSSQQMLDLLRDNLVEVRLPSENVKQAKVIWRFDKGICPDIYTHRAYLDQLCEIFYVSIIRLIKENIGIQPQIVTEPASTHERFKWDALHSWYLVQQMNVPENLYMGYDFQLEAIRSYVRAPMEDGGSGDDSMSLRQPLIICGQAGSGKSTMIARLAILARQWQNGASVIVRYCGLSSSSTSLLLVLESVCRQLEAAIAGPVFNYSTSLPPCEDLLIARMWRLITSVPKSMSLVLLFDGVDRLEPVFPGWLPPTLPANVSIIATVTANNVAQAVRICGMGGMLPESNIIELPGLAPDDAANLLNTILDARGRQLTIDQSHIFQQLIDHVALHDESGTGCLPPLYVSLLASIAETYASDQLSPDTNITAPLPKSLNEAFSYLFDRLEIAHSYTVVSAMFSLLSAAGCALTDCEIEDVLSLDEAFMAVIHKGDICQALQHSTVVPIRRAPPVLWLRLRSDLRAFLLATWETGGQTAWWWRHSSMAAAARQRYLRDRSDADRRLHSRLADYWLGPSSGNEPRPASTDLSQLDSLSNDQQTANNGNNNNNNNNGGSLLIPQPIILQKFGYKTHNVRKLRHLPTQLAGAERWVELAARCLFSYEWIFHKTCALGLTDVILDYTLASNAPTPTTAIEATLVAEALRDIGKTIDFGVIIGDSADSPKRPAAISCLPTELSSRLLPYADTSDNIRSLIVQCDLLGLTQTALLPLLPHPSTPGAALQAELTFRPDGEPASPDCMAMYETADDRTLLFVKTIASSRIGCFQLPVLRRIGVNDQTSNQLPISLPWDIECSAGRMLMYPEKGIVATVDPATRRAIKFHDLDMGVFFGQLIPTPTPKSSPPSSEQNAKTPLSALIRPTSLARTEILSIEMENGILFVCIHEADADCSEVQAYSLHECPDANMWSQQMMANSHVATRWSPPMIASIMLPGKASFMAPSPRGLNVFCGVGNMLCIASLESGQVEFILPAPGRVATALSTVDESCILAICHDDASILLLSDHSRFSAVEALTSDGARIQFDRMRLSPNDTYFAVWNKGVIDILSCSSAKQLNRLCNPFAAPPTAAGVVQNQTLSEMHAFSEIIFTPNEETLIASAGRWLLLWKPVSGQPIARLQAELGVIDRLIPVAKGRLLISHIKGSPNIQVWSLELGSSAPSGGYSTTLPTLPSSGVDHLPAPIEEMTVAADGQLVYAKLSKSQIIGVFSLANGRLVRALEHDTPVVSVVPVASGQFCLVSTVDNVRRNAANRLWDVVDSRVMWRFGNDPGFAAALHKSDCIVHIARMTDVCTIHDPYTVYMYRFSPPKDGEADGRVSLSSDNSQQNRFEVLRLFFEVRYVLSKPFITEDDCRCIFMVAESFDDRADVYSGRAVCVCDISGTDSGTGIAMFGITQLADFVNVAEILAVQPCPSTPTNVIVFYASAQSRQSNRSGVSNQFAEERSILTPSVGSRRSVNDLKAPGTPSSPAGSPSASKPQTASSPRSSVKTARDKEVGFLILDVSNGTVVRCCDHFLTPSSLPLLISSDLHHCLDATGVMYDLVTCQVRLPTLHERGWPARTFLNGGKLAVFAEPAGDESNNRLQVLRTSDCKLVGWVRLWSPITCTAIHGKGERVKLLVGCADGSFTAYMVVDRQSDSGDQQQQSTTSISDVLPNRTTPLAYAQASELLQLFATGRVGTERCSKTAPLFMYKEGRLVAPVSGKISSGRVAGTISSMSLKNKQQEAKPITPPARGISGISASSMSIVRGPAIQNRPRDFRSAACTLM